MKIYFAGSIRGGRQDKDLYLEIIEYLKQKHEVLTEHIGNKELNEFGESTITDEYIFNRDINWLKESNIIVAEVTNPSLGVGYELGLAEILNKKIICLYRTQENKKLSAMINGNNNITVIEYTNIEELKKLLNTKI